jgi:hypothetical protein
MPAVQCNLSGPVEQCMTAQFTRMPRCSCSTGERERYIS